MAKSDSFFIRAQVTTQNDATFDQASVDLGAYVDALGKSVLRIHNVSVQVVNAATHLPLAAAGAAGEAAWQLTTQSQSDLVGAFDKSVVSTGAQRVLVDGNITDRSDVMPQEWTNGYLIGVEQLYLGAIASSDIITTNVEVNVVMECTVETLNQSAAMALALSQQ